MVLTGRTVALALLGVIAAFLSPLALLIWASLIVVAVTVDVATAAPLRTITLQRSVPPPTRLGGESASVVVVRNDSRRTARLLVRDQWVPSAGAAAVGAHLTLRPDERQTLTTVLHPTRRGTRPAVRVTVRSSGPLGLAARQRQRPLSGSLLVLPAFPSRRLLPAKLARVRELEGSVVARRAGRGTEFDALRTYVPGDDATAIDWRATARTDGVVVRTFRPEQDRRVLLVLDTGRSSAARLIDAPRLDAAIDAALLLTAVVSRAGDRVGLVAADTAVRATLGVTGGRDRLRRTAAVLADVEPRLLETDPDVIVAAVTATVGRRALVVLFTDLAASTHTATLSIVAGLVRDHTVVVAAVSDPEVDEAVALAATVAPTGAPGESATDQALDVYTAAAAELTRAQRAATATAVRRLGATVVDVGPDAFASAVTDAYLDLKAGARL